MSHTVRTFLKKTAWIAAIFVLVGGAVLYWSATSFQSATKLKNEGVTAQAQVLQSFNRRERKSSSSSSGSKYVTRYYVRYSFTPEGGETITKRERVSKSFQQETRPGTRIPVTYLASDPSVHEIEPGDTKATGWGTLAIGLIFLGVGGFIGWSGWTKASREGLLIDQGRTAEAEIEAIKELPKNRAQLVYWFADDRGIRTRGKSKSKKINVFSDFSPGQTIRVIYDPDNPQTNAWDRELGMTD